MPVRIFFEQEAGEPLWTSWQFSSFYHIDRNGTLRQSDDKPRKTHLMLIGLCGQFHFKVIHSEYRRGTHYIFGDSHVGNHLTALCAKLANVGKARVSAQNFSAFNDHDTAAMDPQIGTESH